ncbi:hypoxia-inducible factor 1-alpha isoform X3 [Leptinotarsa decemlineata]|uniref:hypoxia-inducible factor 1-alpha isoform X3 n=1 Tax=Leptinotarsa decemlineata TaxID=7539 RepID=UPI003D309DA9
MDMSVFGYQPLNLGYEDYAWVYIKKMNHEKRKEKSRDAARSRRSRETEIFSDLANALPLAAEQISPLDKASIMRLAISYLKVRDMVNLVPELKVPDEETGTDGSIFLKSLDGFIVVLSAEGDFVYLSENVSDYLGLSQIDLMGQNVFEYSHPCDHDEIREIISGKSQDESDCSKSIFMRLKCTLTSKGRSVNLKSAIYKVIKCTGHVVKSKSSAMKEDNQSISLMQGCFIAVGQPIPHPSNIETPLPHQTFLTKHSLDMKFTHADDESMSQILGYDQEDLLGKSVFDYHHAMDSDSIHSAYKCLFSKGQCETGRYRFLAKTGGYVWVVTQATLIHDKMQKPQSVVCVNYVISGLECQDEIYSSSQYSTVKAENNNSGHSSPISVVVSDLVISSVVNNDNNNNNEVTESRGDSKQRISSTAKLFGDSIETGGPNRPQTATSKIFGPRTEDMNKGFLAFTGQESRLTMLKDEPEDLTHLAPVAGDVCVPLEDHPFISDMLDDILLENNFSSILSERPIITSDQFLTYRDFQNTSPQMLSPNDFSKQSDCSLPSLNSPSDSLLDDDMSAFTNIHMEDDPDSNNDILLKVKSPSPIPMSEQFPLMFTTDLMWSTVEEEVEKPESNSSLAQLLSSKHNLKMNDHGGGILQENDMDDIYNAKFTRKNWINNNTNSQLNKLERSPSVKRPNSSTYNQSNKRTRSEPKEKMSSELLHQLMSNNHNRGRQKSKSNWLLENGSEKAACISQPSDSVLMNLLDDATTRSLLVFGTSLDPFSFEEKKKSLLDNDDSRRQLLRKNSVSLLEPEASSLASLMDLNQQDYEVNAPVGSVLLQGQDLLTALEANTASI